MLRKVNPGRWTHDIIEWELNVGRYMRLDTESQKEWLCQLFAICSQVPSQPLPAWLCQTIFPRLLCQFPVSISHGRSWQEIGRKEMERSRAAPPHLPCSCSISVWVSSALALAGWLLPRSPSSSQAASVATARTSGLGFWTPGFTSSLCPFCPREVVASCSY